MGLNHSCFTSFSFRLLVFNAKFQCVPYRLFHPCPPVLSPPCSRVDFFFFKNWIWITKRSGCTLTFNCSGVSGGIIQQVRMQRRRLVSEVEGFAGAVTIPRSSCWTLTSMGSGRRISSLSSVRSDCNTNPAHSHEMILRGNRIKAKTRFILVFDSICF
jgi:hypothetical protein